MANKRPTFFRITTQFSCTLLAFGYLSTAAPQQPGAEANTEPAAAGIEPAASPDAPAVADITAKADDADEFAGRFGAEGLAGPEVDEHIGLLEAQLTLRDRLDHGEYSEAVPVAARLAELTASEYGERSMESAVAISNLAESQRRARLYGDAERNFLASVELFRDLGGDYSESVITPLIGLGVNYQAMEQHPQAVTALEEARTVSRRTHGLLSERQVEILDHIATSLIRMELYEDAEAQKLAAMRIMERVHGEDSLGILPTLYDHARWLRDGFRYDQERNVYGRAMTIIRALEGRNSPLLAQPLRQIGNSFRVQKLPEGRGIGSLKRALEILQAQPGPDKLQMARVLRDIGDWNVAFSRVAPTGDEYREAWTLLDELENGADLQRRWFFEPDYVLHEFPSRRGLADPGEPGARPGHVLVTFDVLPTGRTANVQVLESEPPGLKDESSARSISRSRFRPRLVGGEPTVAEDIARDFTFHYEPDSTDDK